MRKPVKALLVAFVALLVAAVVVVGTDLYARRRRGGAT
jgi:hypothetical protein